MADLIIHPDAEADLERIYRLDRWSASRLIVRLQEFDGDEALLNELSNDFFHREHPGRIDAQYWVEVRKSGRNIFRLKVWDTNDELLPYRVIYAFLPSDDEYHILGIVPREWNYDVEHQISQRIFNAYDDL